jgi:exopolyphosphatase/guanosine-5'-triphosphate,3'-diphosphate pyrophosphatase
VAFKSFGPVGIIDIGSNSVRFVAYGGAARVPSVLFNEKTNAALGRALATTGELDDAAMEQTLEALARFPCAWAGDGAQEAPHRRNRGSARRKQRRGLPKARRRAGASAAAVVGAGGSWIVRAWRHLGHSARQWNRCDLGGGSLELVGVARGGAGEGVSLRLACFALAASPTSTQLPRRFEQSSRRAG